MKLFPVSILTAEKIVYQGEIYALVVPAGLGYMGILADHVPLLSCVTPGKISIKKNPQDPGQDIAVKKKGFLEIARRGVTVLLAAEDEIPL